MKLGRFEVQAARHQLSAISHQRPVGVRPRRRRRLPPSACWRLAAGGWRLAAGDWRLATGDWRLATGD
ncbi:hypothetical protein CKO17_00250 [Marichromatium gracile]|nr:hypothetical protein [Marichromatium gracile]